MKQKIKKGHWISLSLKKKFYWLTGGITALAFLTILVLYLYMNAIMGRTQEILHKNDVNLAFQVAMEAERKAIQTWVSGESSDIKSVLPAVCNETKNAVDALPDQLSDIGLEQYQATWAIQNSYQTYQEKRNLLLALERNSPQSSEYLYEVYDMQNYLLQYGTRLTEIVMREGNRQYQETQSDFHFMPVVLMLVGFFVVISLTGTSRKMDELFIEPVIALSRDAARIAGGNFTASLPARREPDEMGNLIEAFAQMKTSTAKYIDALKENNELQLQLEKVQLQMLKNQMNPHFLFNTLNMISCMAQMEEARVTDRMILAMSRLFQYSLKSSETVTPLSNEIKVVTDYMYLQKMRFEERLHYHIQVGDETENKMVPSFILQPLVENAIVHGIAAKEEGGCICVKSWMDGSKLWISVEDSGLGMNPETLMQLNTQRPKVKGGHGIGLSNIMKRIQILYPDGEVQISSVSGQGTRILMGFTEADEQGRNT